MIRNRFTATLFLFACFAAAQSAEAFVFEDRWGETASGATGIAGDPITLTWSLVPDNTMMFGASPSDFISFMDSEFGAGPGGSDLSLRPWFHFFEESFARWTELGGITYVYEPNDDGATQGSSAEGSSGLLGVRGDVRIGGAYIDGAGGTLGFSRFPDNGDMVLDTGDGSFFSNSSSDYRQLRNTIMHEVGHGFGINHVVSNTSNFLLEPNISIAFEGPQFDDIRGLQWIYGDALEKANGGLGNNTAATATSLGSISSGSSVSIGTDAVDTVVSPSDTDFISIDRSTDLDFFSFTVSGPSQADILLTPLGPTYNENVGGVQEPIDTSSISNLALDFYDTDGTTLLASANLTGAGFEESLTGISLPSAGEYYVRVTGDDPMIQFYQLDVSVEDPQIFLPADFNENGLVDLGDFGDWQASYGLNAGGDTDLDGDTDGLDFLTWQLQFNGGTGFQASFGDIPEPSAAVLALLACWPVVFRRM